jgi:hypothetical protein
MAQHAKRKTLADALRELEATVDMPLVVADLNGADLLAALKLHAVRVHLVAHPVRNAVTLARHCARAAVADAASGRLGTTVELRREPWVLVWWTIAQLTACVRGSSDSPLGAAGPQPLGSLVPVLRRALGADAATTVVLVLEGLPRALRGTQAPVGSTGLDRASLDDALVALQLAGGCRVVETDKPADSIAAIVRLLKAIAEQPYQYGHRRRARPGGGGRTRPLMQMVAWVRTCLLV